MVRLGTAGLNPAYCPSEPEFNILIGRLVDPYVDALPRTERLMTAKFEPPSPPKLSQAEIEAKLGRPLGVRTSSEAPMPAGGGKHALRSMAELAAREARRKVNPEQITQNLGPESQ
jgi:hypothetical protein